MNKLTFYALVIFGVVTLSATTKTEHVNEQATDLIVKAKVEYTIHGNGDKKVIVLHSWMDDYESWKSVIPYLDMQAYTYAFVDLRGYGKSKSVKGKFNSDEIANDVFDVADDLSWNKFFLVGHSMTGMAVQKAVLKDSSKRIQKVVAISPVSSAGFPVDDQTLEFFKSIPQNAKMIRMALGVFTSQRSSSAFYASRTKRNLEAIDKEAQLAYMDMWTKENFSEEVENVETPFLVLWGQYDHVGFLLEAQEKAFAAFKNVELVKIENSGHFPMFETPVFLAASIESYFKD